MPRTAEIVRRRRARKDKPDDEAGVATARPAGGSKKKKRTSTEQEESDKGEKSVALTSEAGRGRARGARRLGAAVLAKATGGKAGDGKGAPRSATLPVPKEHVVKWFDEACSRSVQALKTEFASLRQDLQADVKSKGLVAFNANTARNRYRDVLCFDSSRVKLGDNANQDYIHASWVDGSAGRAICCQAPTDATLADFWAMIWQEEVVSIVMLCETTENGKPKCAQYWMAEAGKNMKHGQYTVHTQSVKEHYLAQKQHAIVSTIELTREGCAPRTVKHLHWGEWPDRGVPADARPVLKLRKLALDNAEGRPIVVHCSAGIGRTGTFIVIDNCMAQMDGERAIDVKETLKKLREQRCHSVQTDIQYIFIHKALIDYAILRHGCPAATAERFNKEITSVAKS